MADSLRPSPVRWLRLFRALFFFAYLAFQIGYPALSWFKPGYDKFTWHMYAGLNESPRFSVAFADGSRRDVGNPLKTGSPVRLLGPSVDQQRVMPPWLCANWDGATAVIVRFDRANREEVHPCASVSR